MPKMINKAGVVCNAEKSQVSQLEGAGFKVATAEDFVEAAVKVEKAAVKAAKAKK